MANIKSARKRAHQAVQLRIHNMRLRTTVRTAIKNVNKALAAGNKDAASKARGRERRHAPQCRRPAQEPPGACPEGHEVTT